jgi:hypothetical protein
MAVPLFDLLGRRSSLLAIQSNSGIGNSAQALDETSIRDALRTGRVYVSRDWMCDPSGFRLEWAAGDARDLMGDETRLTPGLVVSARFPAACHIRLLENGRLVAEAPGDRIEQAITAPGSIGSRADSGSTARSGRGSIRI